MTISRLVRLDMQLSLHLFKKRTICTCNSILHLNDQYLICMYMFLKSHIKRSKQTSNPRTEEKKHCFDQFHLEVILEIRNVFESYKRLV